MTRFLIFVFFVLFNLRTVTAQKKQDYAKDWLVIEKLEVDQKVTSALDKVEVLYQKATRQKNTSQQLKALLFKWKFKQIIDEKSQVTILEELEKEIKTSEFPKSQILHMYMAHFLQTYLNDNYWKVTQRTKTEKASLKNYQTWDNATFLNEISTHYQAALTPSVALANILTDDVVDLLIKVPVSRKYRPTLYDIIAHKALDFYGNSRNRVQKPKDEFLIDKALYFSSSSVFATNKIFTTDKESLLYKGILVRQQLEQIHSQRNNTTAWVQNILNRLAFVKKHYTGAEGTKLHLESLQKLVETFKGKNGIAKIKVALARAYRNLAFQKNEDGKYKFPNYNTQALHLLNEVEEQVQEKDQKSQTKVLVEAKNLKNQILQKKSTWITQNKYLPNKPHLAKVSFTNANQIEVKAYQVPHGFSVNQFNYSKKDSLTKAYLQKRKVHFTKTYTLPKKSDYNSYSTEVAVPPLPLGSYIFRIKIDTLTGSYKYHQLQVTELSVNKAENNFVNSYQVLNRYTGEAVKNAQILIKTLVDRRNKEYKTSKQTTDNWGVFNYSRSNKYEQNTIIIQTQKDTLTISDNSYRRYTNQNHLKYLNAYQSKTLLFLDRAIYRPQQKVYFKAVAVGEEDQKSTMLFGQKIIIKVTDPNRQKVFTQHLTTNEYGSIHGEFTLPDTGLNGRFTITAELEHPKNKRKHTNARLQFLVEEYKRPTFEVVFNPLTKTYKPLDSVKVTGNAKAFLGSFVTDANVSYSVKRTTQYRNWWYFRGSNNESKQLASGYVSTNDKGDFTIAFKAETDAADTTNKIYNYTIEAKVTDLNGETREATTNIKVADKNLLAAIDAASDWNSELKSTVSIKSTDVNGNPIKVNGVLHIYKLQSPGRFLNGRPWSKPDIQTFDKNNFANQFPHIPFSDEKDPKNWKQGKEYYAHSFTKTENVEVEIENFKKWPAGKYILVTEITDPISKSKTETKKAITIAHKKQEFPADETVFVHNVIYDVYNPSKVNLQLQTAAPQLIVFAEVFDGNRSIWKEKISLKKGSKDLSIALPELTYPNLTVQYRYQLYNKFYTEQDIVDFSPKPISLNIEKKHFTDKIAPGAKETWSFVLKQTDNKLFSAEALASMYDASLDQFTKRSWSTNFGFGKNYPRPVIARAMTSLGTISSNFTESYKSLNFPSMPNEKWNFYGFSFNRINSWEYREYITNIKRRLRLVKAELQKKKFLESKKRDKGFEKEITVSGTIISGEDGFPIPGVTIYNLQGEKGAVTDFDGNFTISLEAGDSILIEYIGLKSKVVFVDGNQNHLTITLENDGSALDEVMVIGYGKSSKSKRKSLSKSYSKNDIGRQKMSKMAMESSLELDEASDIQIRGVSSVGSGTEPLYVVDGVPQNSNPNLSPDQIASMDILKDAASIAVYGTRGANGVILITTQKGAVLENLKTITARKNLQETAFFLPNLKTNKKGEIEFQFNAPEELTRWNFRMLAHTQQAKVGKLNLQTLTQKDLSILPNAPRFVREGDQLRFTAKVTNLTAEKMTGTALLEWTDPTTGNTVNQVLKHSQLTQKFSIAANSNSLLSWNIAIPENLNAIQYKIVAQAGNFSDGEEKIIPVLSNRMLVTESVPLWVRAGETESFDLANFEPNSDTQKPHQITLEYTSNPAWIAIKSLPYLMEFPHECSEQTFSRLYANTMAAHILNSQPKIKAVFDSWKAKGTLLSPLESNKELKNILLAESPWLQEAQSETEQQQRLGALFDLEKTTRNQQKAINKLRQLQKPSGGFPWFAGGYANSYITRHIVAGFGHLEKLGVIQQRSKTDNIVRNAIRFLDKELIKDYNNYLKHHKTAEGFYKQVRLLHFAYARSFYKDRFPLKGQSAVIIGKALSYQETQWQSRTIYEKGILALVLHRFKKSVVTQKILTALTESAVNSKANGMYWKENTQSWWWYRNPIVTQSLLIEAFTETDQPKKYVEEMKIFLLKNKRTNRWETTIETANASYALLLQGNDWLSLKDNTVIEVGGTKIKTKKLSETEKEQGTGYLKTSWKASEITPEFNTVKVTNKSSLTGYGGYYWQYFEDLDKIKVDSNTPMSIQKQLYKKQATDKGTELKEITVKTPLKVGDKVTVRLLIKSDNAMEFVHLKDMRASGFEPVAVLSGYNYKDGLGYYQSSKDVATHFFIDHLPKGNYVLEYDVIANQKGSFSNGITQLQCMYAPEFSSHSQGQRVDVE